MHIAIDGNEANVSSRVGIGQYAFHIISGLSDIQKKEDHKHRDHYTVYLKDQPQDDMPVSSPGWSYKVIKPKRLWTQFAFPFRLYTGLRPDVVFSPSHYAPRWSPVPCVISIMDLSFLHFPKLFTKRDLYQLTQWTQRSISRAEHIITISEYTKNDIVSSYHIDPKKITVTYLGYDSNYFHMKENQSTDSPYKTLFSFPYILFVGTVQPRKNIIRLIEAFEAVRKHEQSLKDLQLVIVGKKGWLWEETIMRMQMSEYASCIHYLDFAEDEHLADLYRNAQCFVLPSLFEGFGIPVLEAMASGCPVIVSNKSSLPEIVEDAGLIIDPDDTTQLADAILNVVSHKSTREELKIRGLKRVREFSWDRCVLETLEVLHSI